uniref:Uncharacterized protein n=1 Tax=Denticeps clupeoides TaxID=299321 RepID=A0AAY4CRC3_9TELE
MSILLKRWHVGGVMSNSLLRACLQLGVRWVRQPEPLPYMVSQPLPWQVHSVSHSRRGSRAEEVSFTPANTHTHTHCPPASPSVEKAAATIQHQYRKYQQKKHKENK